MKVIQYDCCAHLNGFAAVDALVSLALLAAVIVLALGAGHQARLSADRALELVQVGEYAKALLEQSRASGEGGDGIWRSLKWSVQVGDVSTSAGGAEICLHDASIVGPSGRKYLLSTAVPCVAP